MYVKRSNCSWYRQPPAMSSRLTEQKIQKQEEAKQNIQLPLGNIKHIDIVRKVHDQSNTKL